MRQSNDECGAFAIDSVEVESASMFIDDDGAGDSEALTCAFSDLLGSEERIEDASSDVEGDSEASVPDSDFDSGR